MLSITSCHWESGGRGVGTTVSVSLLRNVVVVFFRRQTAERRQVRTLPADISLPGTHNTADIYFPDFLLAPDKEDS